MDGLRGGEKAIDTATRETLLGNSLVVVAPKASAQADITINKETNWTSLLNGGRLAVGDPEHVPAGSTPKKRCKNWAHGRHCHRSWPRRKMCAARWRWWNATKPRWVLCTALMPLPAKV
jgi:hypothetical protein